MATRVLEVVLSGDSVALERAFMRSEKAGAKAANGLIASGRKMQTAGAAMSSAGKTLTRNVSLPVAAIGAVAVKTAIDFEKAMRNVNSIAQLPEPAFKRLNKDVLSLAGPTAQAPKTLAEGLYDLVSSGFNAKESMTILKSSAKAATAGLTTTEISTKAVAAALNAYHRPAGDAAKVSDDLFETVNRGVVTFDELAGSIGFVLPAASTMGINLKEVGAAIATLTKEGQSGETAITNINQAATAFIKPSKAMKAVLKELGYETSKQLIDQKGFQGAIEAVTGAVGGGEEAIGELFGNVRAMRAVFGLTGKSARTAGEDLQAFGNDTGSTAKVFKEQSKSIAFQWNKLKAEAAVLGVEMGHKLIPVLRSVGKTVQGMVRTFLDLPGGVQKSIVQFGLLAIALGPALRLTGALTTGLGKLLELGGAIKAAKLGSALAESFSIFRTGMASGQGMMGSFQIAGGKWATSLVSGLKLGIPTAIAAAGVGNILSSALSGDTKGTIEKTGGAIAGTLIGAIAGSFAGSPVLGAALGGGIGSFLGPAIASLFGKQLHPLQEKLAASSKALTASFKAERSAVKSLANSGDDLVLAHKRQRNASQNVEQAERRLGKIRRESGPNSRPAIKAELDLVDAKHKAAQATRQEQNAERQHGAQLKATKVILRANALEERHAITILGQKRRAIFEEIQQTPKTLANWKRLKELQGQLNANTRQTSAAQRKQAQTQLDAAQQVGPKFTKFLQQASRGALNMGHNFNVTLKDIKGPIGGALTLTSDFGEQTTKSTTQAKGGYERLKGALGPFRSETKKQMEAAKGDVRSFDRTTVTSMSDVVGKLNSSLAALGVKEISFGGAKKQRGGDIAGSGTGDKVPALLEPGEYVLNRNAVKAVGSSTLDSLNFGMAPRFQRGGALGPEPHIGGTQPLHGAGQSAIHQVYTAATRYYNQHNGKARVIANGNRMDAMRQPYLWGGGHGATASVNGPWDCSGGISELFDGAGWSFPPMVSGGFTNWGLPGKGDISVLANAEHVYAVVQGKGAIGTSGENPGGGFGWISGYTFRPGFTIRHADFSEQAMARSSAGGRGKGQKQKKGFQTGGIVAGKVSFFGGGATAGGSNTSKPGIALNLNPGTESGWNNPTTQGWRDASLAGHPVFARVTIAGHAANLPITDMGPAASTGRAIDVTEGGVRKLGFTTSNFPTDATGKAVIMGAGGAAGGKSKKERAEERRAAIKAAAIGPGKAIWANPLKPTPLPKSAAGLSPTIKGMLKAPGLTYSGKVGISELALSQAEDTKTHADDEAALNYQESLFLRRQKQIKAKLAQVLKKLKVVRNPAEQKKLLGQAAHLREELGGVQGSLSGVRSTRKGLSESEGGEGEAAEDPAVKAAEEAKEASEALQAVIEEHKAVEEELTKQIKEQVDFAKSATATSSATAWRALADILSGQLGPLTQHRAALAGNGSIGSVGSF
jgi:TP901 family phage tail tape measure protein